MNTSKTNVSIGNRMLSFLLMVLMMFNGFIPFKTQSQTNNSESGTMGDPVGSAGYSVDPFTGDFSYSIPLLDVGGYPISIKYNPNISMESEASWVGLGWTLNVGSIDRNMRGIPDDFNGEDVVTNENSKEEDDTDGDAKGGLVNLGVNVGFDVGFGVATLGVDVGASWMKGSYINTFRGKGVTEEFNFNGSLSGSLGFMKLSGVGGVSGGWGHTSDSQNGRNQTDSRGFFGGFSAFGIPIAGSNSILSTSYNTRSGIETYTKSKTTSLFYSSNTGTTRTFSKYSFLPSFGYNFQTVYEEFRRQRAALLSFGISSISLDLEAGAMEKDYTIDSEPNEFTQNAPAIGYLNLHEEHSKDAILDYNREKEQVIKEETKLLPVGVTTYDIFSVSNSFYSGQFRAHRNDVGVYSDPIKSRHSKGKTEIDYESYGVWYKETKGEPQSVNEITTGRYTSSDNSSIHSEFKFKGKSTATGGEYEPYYFKKIGENTPTNMNLWDYFKGNDPVYFLSRYDQTNKKIIEDEEVDHFGTAESVLASVSYQPNRTIRRDFFKPYLNSELEDLGWYDEIDKYPILDEQTPNDFTFSSETRSSKSYRKDHHIGMVDVTDQKGITYRYGVPVYSLKDVNCAFSVGDGKHSQFSDASLDMSEIDQTGLLKYHSSGDNTSGPGVDNEIGSNQRGAGKIVNKTTLHGYAKSYLISDITSPNYIDISNNGPTPDDKGSYVKFNYSNLYDNTDPFKWRTPYSEKSESTSGFPKARHYEGTTGDPYDDMGIYQYGEKEVWYIQTIETKNYIAEFYLEDRKDAFSVNNENGGFDDTKPLKCLKKIILYSRNDRLENGGDATPLKTIEFDYDYTLCESFPGNENYFNSAGGETGKLTLKFIHITTGNSKELHRSPYEFTYSSENPDYHSMAFDRWGNYKPNNSSLPNSEYPYAVDDEALANQYANSWKLIKVQKPTGGTLEVEYEADRYSNVQDKRAMKMVNVFGAANQLSHIVNMSNPYTGSTPPTSENAFRTSVEDEVQDELPNEYLYFELEDGISGNYSDARKELIRQYFSNNYNSGLQLDNDIKNYLYYNFKVDIDEEYTTSTAEFDQHNVKGFTKIVDVGVVGDAAPYQYGFIRVESPKINYKKKKKYRMHSIQRAALQSLRINLSWRLFSITTTNTSNGQPNYIWHTFYDDKELKKNNANKFLYYLDDAEMCLNFNEEESFVRLYDPDAERFGGNYRVKNVKITDDWNAQSGENDASYELEYIYSNYDDYANSAGISTYEPSIGSEENPHYLPEMYTEENLYLPDDYHYQILPYGESYFPGAVVGYPNVKVKYKDIANVNANAVGFTEYKYNTSKFYPFVTKRRQRDIKMPFVEIYEKLGITHYLNWASQGYVIETNDMHGKVAEINDFDRNGNEISSTKYEYYDFDDKQPVLKGDGELDSEYLNKDFDIVLDKFSNDLFSLEGGEIKSQSWPLVPIPSFNKGFLFAFTHQEFRGTVLTKSINHRGIVKSVTSNYMGSKTKNEILAFDRQTGSPIIATSNSEFSDANQDNFSSVTLPAHMKYKSLSGYYNNDNLNIFNINIGSNGYVSFTGSEKDKLQVGDFVEVSDGSNIYYYNVSFISPFGFWLIDENGGYTDGALSSMNLRVMHSGNENRQSLSMESYSVLGKDLFDNDKLRIVDTTVLTAGAVEFEYNEQLLCDQDYTCKSLGDACGVDPQSSINPFAYGLMTDLFPVRSYAYQTDLRDIDDNTPYLAESDPFTQIFTRYSGTYADFTPFYKYDGNGDWYSLKESLHPEYDGTLKKWRLQSEASLWDEKGRIVDVENAIGNHTATLYGYNGSMKLLPTAIAINAKLNQIAYDGIEDYHYLNQDDYCEVEDHFSFRKAVQDGDAKLDSTEKHTGDYSLLIEVEDEIEVSRVLENCTGGENHSIGDEGQFNIGSCNCIQKFSPDAGKYVASMWVKVVGTEINADSYTTPNIFAELIYSGGNNQYTLNPVSPIIDGWQKFEAVFDIDPSETCFALRATNTTNNMYIDDIRVHPFLSSMSSVVYDKKTLIPTATHNTENYSTFYQYNNALEIVGRKVETIKGIHSIEDQRSGIKK